MPRFALLLHTLPAAHDRKSHWDLLLEPESAPDGLLSTWALSTPLDGPQPINAERLADHRRLYLDYEGPVSGDRGEVQQVDAGEYLLLSDSPSQTVIRLVGQRFHGQLTITRGDASAARIAWAPA